MSVWFRLALLAALAAALQLTVLTLAAASQEDGVALWAVSCGCALANVVAFASYRPQVRGLIGSKGLAPAQGALQRMEAAKLRFARGPCCFRLLKSPGTVSDRTP
ncbi:unnamed protein product [Effrenium voratum]|nr:unnamed protein product [Effrenium voratum]